MTIVIGLEHKNGLYMAGDSSAVGGWSVYPTRLRKVFVRKPFIIGYTTSFRMGQLLQYRFELPEHDPKLDDLEFMATAVIDAIRKCLSEGGFTKSENQREEGGSFLIGYNRRLYHVTRDFQVNSSQLGMLAVGGGAEYAEGAMMASPVKDPEKRLLKSLEIASQFYIGAIPPFYVEKLKYKKS